MNYWAAPGISNRIEAAACASEAKIMRVINTVAGYFGYTYEKMCNRSRISRKVLARHIAMYIMRKDLRMSWSEIGRRLKLDYTTAIHAYKRISDLLSVGDDYVQDLHIIRNKLNSKQ